jgi:hypothetical protein
VVKTELEKLHLHCRSIEMVEVDIEENISPDQYEQLNIALKNPE